MSLDVYLTRKRWISYDEGKTYEEDEDELFSANITHNLVGMAKEAGIYEVCWRPENIPNVKAKDIIPTLEKGLSDMKARPEHYKKFDNPNGWGLYVHFVPWLEAYLHQCKLLPEALVSASR